MKHFMTELALILALASAAGAQQTFLIWCSANSGASTMGTASSRAFGVVGQGAIGETRGGAFWVRGGFVTDTLVLRTIVGVGGDEELPLAYVLDQNFPNPFNPATTIRYSLRNTQWVVLKIYSIVGEEVATLVDQQEPAGVHAVTWNAAGCATGVYFCRLRTEEFTATRKLLLVR